MPLQALTSGEIAGLFGRKDALLDHTPARSLPLGSRCILVALVAAAIVVLVASLEHVLLRVPGGRSALGIVITPPRDVRAVGMALLQDPVGLITLVVTLATPLFCSQQVRAMGDFVAMNERNLIASGQAVPNEATVTRLIERANHRFDLVGRRSTSIAILGCALGVTAGLYYLFVHEGLMGNWNSTGLRESVWAHKVYLGWWANLSSRPALAACLYGLGVYMFYYLTKQLLMGGVFADFAARALRVGFGVTPNIEYDSDGYNGLRTLRIFMQITYLSSLAHFVIMLAVLAVWLPLTALTFAIAAAVFVTNSLVVIYPSLVAYRSAIAVKQQAAERIFADGSVERRERQEAVARLWATPGLPFRARSSLTAVTIYLVFPLFLAIVSGTVKG